MNTSAPLGSRRDAGGDLFGEDDEFGSLAPAHKPVPRPSVKADAAAGVTAVKGEAATHGHATTGASDAHTTGHETPRLPEQAAAWDPDAHASRPAATQEAVLAHAPQAAAPQVHLAPADMQLALVPAPGVQDSPQIAQDAKFFIIKSYNHDNIGQSITTGVWSTQAHNEVKLGAAFASCSQVLLIFSVNGSGHFQGYARMETPIGRAKGRWAGDHTRQLGSLFGIQWLCLHDVPFGQTNYLLNPLNEGKPVKISRDGQELPHALGTAMVQLFERGAAAAGAPRPKPRPEVEWEATEQGDVVPSALALSAPAPHRYGSGQHQGGRHGAAVGRGEHASRQWGQAAASEPDGGLMGAMPQGGWWGHPVGWAGSYGMPPHGYGPWGGWGPPPLGWGGDYPDDRRADRRPRSKERRRSRSRSRSRSRERGRDRRGKDKGR